MSILSLANNQANFWRFLPAQDADATPINDESYTTSIASAAWIIAQNLGGVRDDNRAGRVCTVREWLIAIPSEYGPDTWGLKINDRVDLLASDGMTVTAQLYIDDIIDAGGRGEAFEVPAVQIL